MLVGFLLAFSVTDKAWQKFQTNPTFTSLILNQHDIRIAYPTITVCPGEAEDPQKVEEFIKKLGVSGNDSEEIAELLKAIPNFSYGSHGLKSLVTSDVVRRNEEKLFTTDPRVLAFKLAKSCDAILGLCYFKGQTIECCSAFLPVYSEHGFCYAFNTKTYGSKQEE